MYKGEAIKEEQFFDVFEQTLKCSYTATLS